MNQSDIKNLINKIAISEYSIFNTLPDSNSTSMVSESDERFVSLKNFFDYSPSYVSVKTKTSDVKSISDTVKVRIYQSSRIESPKIKSSVSFNDVGVFFKTTSDFIDARNNGGGLSPYKIGQLEVPKAYFDSGYFDGRHTPASYIVNISLPEDIKTKFKEPSLSDVIKTYMPAGLYPVLQYYQSSTVNTLNGGKDIKIYEI